MHAEFEAGDRLTSGWRGIAAAWAVVLLVVLLFAGYSAVQHTASQRQAAPAARIVIPRHDPLCDGIGATPRAAPEACAAPTAPLDDEILLPAPM